MAMMAMRVADLTVILTLTLTLTLILAVTLKPTLNLTLTPTYTKAEMMPMRTADHGCTVEQPGEI